LGRAAFRALAVCVVLLVPGPRTASPEAPRPFRTAASSLVLRPTPRAALPQVVEPPPFLVAQAPRGARPGISSPTGVPPSGGTRARIAGPGSAQTARRPRPPASAQAARQYTVVEGDSLWSIARRFGTTVEALVAVNGISEADFLQPGQVLRVPTGRQEAPGPRRVFTYTVRQGDTLWAIALKTGVRVEDLPRRTASRETGSGSARSWWSPHLFPNPPRASGCLGWCGGRGHRWLTFGPPGAW
jgi:LysM repeat protein